MDCQGKDAGTLKLYVAVCLCMFFQEVKSVYQVLVAVLHAGNVEFVETDNNNHAGDACTVANTNILQIGMQE